MNEEAGWKITAINAANLKLKRNRAIKSSGVRIDGEKINKHHSRRRKFTFSPKLFTLNAFWFPWVALDLLFSTSRACNGKPLTRFSGLRNAPLSIDHFTVNDLLTGGAVFVHPAGTFSGNDLLSHNLGQRLDYI